MQRMIVLVFLLLLPALLSAQVPGDIRVTTGTLNGIGQTAAFSVVNDLTYGAATYMASNHTVQAFKTGSPASCSFRVYGSLKLLSENPAFPADYYDLSGSADCTTETMIHLAFKPVPTMIIDVTALSGGATIQFRYAGKRQ